MGSGGKTLGAAGKATGKSNVSLFKGGKGTVTKMLKANAITGGKSRSFKAFLRGKVAAGSKAEQKKAKDILKQLGAK